MVKRIQILLQQVFMAIAFCTISQPLHADSIYTSTYESWMEDAVENGESGDDLNEQMEEFLQNRININRASREELESIPFLNNQQVEYLAYYLYRYGPIVSLSELKLVEGLDAEIIEKITPMLYVDTTAVSTENKKSIKNILRFGKQEFRTTLGRTIEQAKGFLPNEDFIRMYPGDPNALECKYTFNYKRILQFGFLMEKDPGERMYTPKKDVFDGKSFHLLLKTGGRLKSVALGDYKIRLGEGLICNQGFRSFRNAPGLSFEQTGSILNKHHSASSLNHFRGIAASYSLFREQNALLTVFNSIRALDSNVDSIGFSSIQTNNLHRTPQELANKNSIRQLAYGANVTLQWDEHQCGISFVRHSYSRRRYSDADSYKPESMNGKHFQHFSLNGKTNISSIHLYGEIAMDKTFHTAGIFGMDFKPHKRIYVNLLCCLYSPQYSAEFGQSPGFGSSVSNEKSLSFKMYYHPFAFWHLFCMVDLARFPSSKFQTMGPTTGQKFTVEMAKKSQDLSEWKIKFIQRYTEQNYINDLQKTPSISSAVKHQLKMHYIKKDRRFTTKTALEINRYDYKKAHDWGLALAQDFGCQFNKNSGINWQLALFNTESYENTIYFLEKAMPGSFSIPALYGNGLKQSLYAFTKFRNTTLRVQYQFSHQPKDKTMGSGNDLISGNRKNQWRIQCVHTW